VRHAFDKVAPTITLRAVADGDLATSYLGGLPPFEDRASHPTPGLVLMDLKLPKRSGHEVLEWLRGQPGMDRLPVVILSSSTERADIERAYALGANAYVPKRGDLQELIELVRGLVTYATLARTR
jgi:DNA-binding NarL/FixJ family response regulator